MVEKTGWSDAYYYTELTVYPYLHVSDFEPGLLDKARRLIRAMTPKHPWLPLSDEELLHKAGFWRNDPLTGREGIHDSVRHERHH